MRRENNRRSEIDSEREREKWQTNVCGEMHTKEKRERRVEREKKREKSERREQIDKCCFVVVVVVWFVVVGCWVFEGR